MQETAQTVIVSNLGQSLPFISHRAIDACIERKILPMMTCGNDILRPGISAMLGNGEWVAACCLDT